MIGLLAVACSPAYAEPLCEYVQTGMYVHHYDREAGHNESNKMFGCEGILGSKMSVTYFENSYSDDAVTVSYDYSENLTESISYGAYAGINYGYGDKFLNVGGVSVHVLPHVSYNGDNFGINLFLLYDQGVAVGFKWRL